MCVIMCGERDGEMEERERGDKGSVSQQRGNLMVVMRLLFGTVVFVSLCCCICFWFVVFFYAACCFFFVDDVVVKLYTSLTYTMMCEEVTQISKFEIRRGERERQRDA